jgi:hypothetical protein
MLKNAEPLTLTCKALILKQRGFYNQSREKAAKNKNEPRGNKEQTTKSDILNSRSTVDKIKKRSYFLVVVAIDCQLTATQTNYLFLYLYF